MEAKIILTYENAEEAKTVSQAVSPDNEKTPENLSVDTFYAENQVVASIHYKGDNVMTFASTIDDLLSCVTIAEKTFSVVKKRASS